LAELADRGALGARLEHLVAVEAPLELLVAAHDRRREPVPVLEVVEALLDP
jgi:hypothetical protein